MAILEHFMIDLSDTTTGEATVAPLTTEARHAFDCHFGTNAVSVNIPLANVNNLLNSLFEVVNR